MLRHGRGLRLVFILSGALLCATPSVVLAQIDTGAISGLVTDQTGGALPGVTITVTSTTTGQARMAVTNETGRYQVSALQPSRYPVKPELQRLSTAMRPEVTVNGGAPV